MRKLKAIIFSIFLFQTGVIAYYSADFIGSMLGNNNSYGYADYSRDPVNVCVLHRGRFIGSITTYGKIKSSFNTTINTPQISGYKIIVDKVFFKTGQKINKGEPLVKFDCKELEYKLESVKKDYEQQNEYFERVSKAKGHVSEHEHRKAKLQYEKAYAEYNAIKSHASSLLVVTPFAGTVGMISLVEGEDVTKDRVITQIVDEETLDVEFFVDSSSAESLVVGSSVSVETVDGEYATVSYITDINPYIDEHISKVKVKARLEGESLDTRIFKHNLNVNVIIDKLPVEDVFVIPRTAIVDSGSSSYVCKVEKRPGTYETRMIRITIIDYKGEKAAIIGPSMNEGDYVVYEGYIKRDGISVVIKEIMD